MDLKEKKDDDLKDKEPTEEKKDILEDLFGDKQIVSVRVKKKFNWSGLMMFVAVALMCYSLYNLYRVNNATHVNVVAEGNLENPFLYDCVDSTKVIGNINGKIYTDATDDTLVLRLNFSNINNVQYNPDCKISIAMLDKNLYTKSLICQDKFMFSQEFDNNHNLLVKIPLEETKIVDIENTVFYFKVEIPGCLATLGTYDYSSNSNIQGQIRVYN